MTVILLAYFLNGTIIELPMISTKHCLKQSQYLKTVKGFTKSECIEVKNESGN